MISHDPANLLVGRLGAGTPSADSLPGRLRERRRRPTYQAGQSWVCHLRTTACRHDRLRDIVVVETPEGILCAQGEAQEVKIWCARCGRRHREQRTRASQYPRHDGSHPERLTMRCRSHRHGYVGWSRAPVWRRRPRRGRHGRQPAKIAPRPGRAPDLATGDLVAQTGRRDVLHDDVPKRWDAAVILSAEHPAPPDARRISATSSWRRAGSRARHQDTLLVEKSRAGPDRPVDPETCLYAKRPGLTFDVASNPEFTREGWRGGLPPPGRLVLGVASPRRSAPPALYAPIVEALRCPVHPDCRVTGRAGPRDRHRQRRAHQARRQLLPRLKITFANAVADVCEAAGRHPRVVKGVGWQADRRPSSTPASASAAPASQGLRPS